MKNFVTVAFLISASLHAVSGRLWSDEPAGRKEAIERAVRYVRSAQSDDGSFSSKTGPGVTGLVTAGLLSIGLPPSDPTVAKSLKYLEGTRREDGGLYAPQSRHANYETCLSMMAFSKANSDGRYTVLIQGAEKFVKQQQWDEGEGLKSDDPAFGGAGYGSKSRPDLSNTAFLIDALRSAGCSEEDEAIQRALTFVSRCQNLESPANNTPFAPLVNDGGFYYTPAAGGESFAGKEPNGGLRSYASMTYAGLKSMVFAGVDKDDYRVKAAKNFLYNNYSVASNPGMGTSGLYYYQQTMAKALQALGDQEFQTKDGPRNWRSDLTKQILATQNTDGSWTNSDARWMEGDANLVTGYVLLTLSFIE
jgi:squalene-hopene/tetraprenyl-beta-curcumene cyclase